MSTVTHDAAPTTNTRVRSGLAFALLAAASFGASGPVARGLLTTGWSPGAAVTARVLIAAVVLAPVTVLSLRGRWFLLRRNALLLIGYGLVAVDLGQLCYFNAVARLPVGVAMLIEFTAPAAVVGWLWLRHGQRPSRLTVVGALAAAAGLILVLDLLAGFRFDPVGVLWALGAMVGAATYFVLSADDDSGLPPIVLAGAGLTIGGLGLAVAGAVGVMPIHAGTADAAYPSLFGTFGAPWWLSLASLGLVSAALAYLVGIEGGRRLGSRLASFLGLLEVLMALVFAWLLLAEVPTTVQLIGGALVLLGLVVVKLGERPAAVETAGERGAVEPEVAAI